MVLLSDKSYIKTTNGIEHYCYDPIYSRQTGTNGEVCWVLGGKNIGKTFNLRVDKTKDALKTNRRFVEVCRSDNEAQEVSSDYMSKIVSCGYFRNLIFRSEKKVLYYAHENEENPNWQPLVYFVALSLFQKEKKRTYTNVSDFIFDEAIIDKKDRFHHYLPNEWLILGNLVDTITREQPNDSPTHHIYLIGNACDLSCPLLYDSGVTKVPDWGFSWWNDKHTLVHNIEPWNAEDRQTRTLAGRMLAAHKEESAMVFENKFSAGYKGDISEKTSNSKFAFGIKFGRYSFGVWIDYKAALWYVCRKIPKGSKAIYTLVKADMRLDYQAIKRNAEILQMLSNIHYAGGLRYENALVRETFAQVLEYIGIK